jgi:hypothetical protein
MDLKPGTRLRSVVDTTEVIVVRAPEDVVDLRCGGHGMIGMTDSVLADLAILDGFDQGCQIGKRYVHELSGLELLCTKGGPGAVSVGDELLPVKGAKPLPSSD